ncbi:MAG TPA: dihydroneopterin aldolase [Gammaproteobacteria bacterium]|jgi:dihydroneopterin aldolase|nr:dihydroneopterin aldolase [Gammaproteobacteria bacterium]
MHTKLNLHQLEIPVTLGWSAEERFHPQIILLNLEIIFAKPPKACLSDELTDTFCYHELSQLIGQHITKKEYRLIELLTRDIYEITKKFFVAESSVKISLTKKPKLPFENHGVTFTFGDH